jgi:hypothetical protein
MENVIYLSLGILDSFAILALALRIYRFPFWEYFKEICLIAALASGTSFFVRVILSMPALDMAVQYMLYVLLLRYIIHIRFFPALLIAAVGYLSFTGVQFIVYPTLILTNVVTFNDAKELEGVGTYLIQISSEAASYLVCWLLYKLNLGYACFPRPPHEIQLKDKMTGTNLHLMLSTLLAVTVIFSTLYWILNYHAHIFIVLPTVAAALCLLLYLSQRKDYGL